MREEIEKKSKENKKQNRDKKLNID